MHQKLTKDAKQLQNKIRAFLKSLGVDARPKRIKLTVDFLCDFVNEDHNKAVKEVESEVFKDNISIEDVTFKPKELNRVEVLKAPKASKIIIP